MASNESHETVLEVNNLSTSFFTEEGEVRAVDDVSFKLIKGRTLGIVGESGCGKSVTALSIMRLIPNPPGRITNGEILYQERNLATIDINEMRKIRGNEISMIFQEPMTSLNPVFTIGFQIAEAVKIHQKLDKSLGRNAARDRAIEMLKLVGIPSPEKRVDDYPHQLSGGMRQRVMIAIALSCNPNILIADEPTTALDVTIQAQILELMNGLCKTLGMSLILITHDLGVVAETAHDVVVMYAGKIVEYGPVKEVFSNPKHPYTKGLLQSLPKFGAARIAGTKPKRLETIPGIVPSLLDLPKGCRFQTRCSYVVDQCKGAEPTLRDAKPGHLVSCYKDL